MKEIRIKFLELHEPIFIGSMNVPAKIDAVQKGMSIVRHIDEKYNIDDVHILYKGFARVLPWATCKQYEPFDTVEAGISMKYIADSLPKNPEPRAKVQAQVSAPQGIKI